MLRELGEYSTVSTYCKEILNLFLEEEDILNLKNKHYRHTISHMRKINKLSDSDKRVIFNLINGALGYFCAQKWQVLGVTTTATTTSSFWNSLLLLVVYATQNICM